MSPGLRAALAAVVFLVLLLALAPARVLGVMLPPGQVALSGYSGSLWRGSASRALVATPGGWLHLGRVQWRLRPWSLLLLTPRLAVDSNWGSQLARGDVIVRGYSFLSLHLFHLFFLPFISLFFSPFHHDSFFSLYSLVFNFFLLSLYLWSSFFRPFFNLFSIPLYFSIFHYLLYCSSLKLRFIYFILLSFILSLSLPRFTFNLIRSSSFMYSSSFPFFSFFLLPVSVLYTLSFLLLPSLFYFIFTKFTFSTLLIVFFLSFSITFLFFHNFALPLSPLLPLDNFSSSYLKIIPLFLLPPPHPLPLIAKIFSLPYQYTPFTQSK